MDMSSFVKITITVENHFSEFNAVLEDKEPKERKNEKKSQRNSFDGVYSHVSKFLYLAFSFKCHHSRKSFF
jgi:hypothetical protein